MNLQQQVHFTLEPAHVWIWKHTWNKHCLKYDLTLIKGTMFWFFLFYFIPLWEKKKDICFPACWGAHHSNARLKKRYSLALDPPSVPWSSPPSAIYWALWVLQVPFSLHRDFAKMIWNQRTQYTTMCFFPQSRKVLKQFKERFRWVANGQTKFWKF